MGLTKNIGVVGAGVIGVGVAQSLSEAGFKVILLDLSEKILDFAKDEIYKNCRFKGFLSQNVSNEDPESVISKIEFTTDYSILNSCDFIVENVTEKPEVKKEVYGKLDSVCHGECIYLVNTSCISITKISSFC